MCKYGWIFIFYLPLSLYAQNSNIEDFIQVACQNNLSLQSAQKQIQAAQQSVHPGIAGNRPSISFQGNLNAELNNITLTFFDGRVNTANNAENYGANAAIEANYALYENGLKSIRQKQLQKQYEQQNLNYQNNQSEVVSNTLNLINQLLWQEEQLKVLRQDTSYWHQLYQLRSEMVDIGRGTKVDVLQIQSEIRNVERNIMQLQKIQALSIAQLSMLTYEDSINTQISQQLPAYLNKQIIKSKQTFAPLAQSEKTEELLMLNLKEINKQKLPILNSFIGYNYAWSRNAVGILLSNQNFGPYAGLSLQWNLYNGGALDQREEILQTQILAQKDQSGHIKRSNEIQINALKDQLELELNIKASELKRLDEFREQLQIIEKQYRLGKVNIIEVLNYKRQMQLAELQVYQSEFEYRRQLIELLNQKGIFQEIVE